MPLLDDDGASDASSSGSSGDSRTHIEQQQQQQQQPEGPLQTAPHPWCPSPVSSEPPEMARAHGVRFPHAIGLNADGPTYEQLCAAGAAQVVVTFPRATTTTFCSSAMCTHSKQKGVGPPLVSSHPPPPPPPHPLSPPPLAGGSAATTCTTTTTASTAQPSPPVKMSAPASSLSLDAGHHHGEPASETAEGQDDVDAVINVVDEVQLCQLVPVLPRSFPFRRLMRQVITTTKLSSSSDGNGTGSHHRQTEGGLKLEEPELETAAAAATAIAAVQVRCRSAYRKYLYRVVGGMYPGCRGPAASPALFQGSVVGDDKKQDCKPGSSSSTSGEGSAERSSNSSTTGSTTAGSEWMTAGRRLYRTLRPLLLSRAGQSGQQHTTTTNSSSTTAAAAAAAAEEEETKNDEERVMRLLLLALGDKAEKAVNQKGSASSTTAAGPSPPSVAMVEWETGDVDLTEDTEGIMLEQQLRMQRSFYLPPTPLQGDGIGLRGERVSDTKEGTATTATPRSLREAAACQISRLGLFYRERMSSLHRLHSRTLRTGDASGPSPDDEAVNHPCHCTAACGHWAAEYVQVPHHTQSNNGNEAVTPVLLYTDALAQRSTLFMLNAKGLPRPLRWMTAAPTTSQHSLPPSRPSATDMLASQEKAAQLHFSFFDRSRIRFEAVQEERRTEAQSLLSRLLESCGSGSASAQQQQQRVVQAISELWIPSAEMPEGVDSGEVDETTIALRRAALQSFHDDVTDNLLVVSMRRDGAPHHNRLVPPSVALGYLLCDDLEAVLATFATMGNGREEKVDEESSTTSSCRFSIFCDIFFPSVSLYLTLHAPSLLSQQPFQDLRRRYHRRSGNDDTADLQEGGRPSLLAFPVSASPSQHLDDTSGLDAHHIVLLSFLCVAQALRQRCEELTGLVVKALTHTLHQRVLVMYDLIRSSLPAAPSSFNCDSPVTGSSSAPLSSGYATPSAAASATYRFAAQHTSPEQQQRYVTWYEGQPSPAGLLNLLQHSGLWSGALRQLFSTWLSEDNAKCSKTTAEDHHSQQQQQPPTNSNSTGAGPFLHYYRGGESPAGESPSSSSVSPPSPPPQAHTAPSSSSSSAGLPADITEFSLLSQNFLHRSITVLCGAEAAGWLSHAAAGTPLMTPAKKKPRTAAAGGGGSSDTARRKRQREEEEEAAAAAAAAAISMPYYLAGPSVAAPLLAVRSSSTVFPDAFTSPGLFAGRVLVCVLQRAGRTLTFAELMRYIMYLSEASEGGGSGGGGGYTGMRLSDRRKRNRTAASSSSSSTATHSSHHRRHPEDEDDEEEHSTPLPSPLAAGGAAPRKRGRPRKVVPGAAPPHH